MGGSLLRISPPAWRFGARAHGAIALAATCHCSLLFGLDGLGGGLTADTDGAEAPDGDAGVVPDAAGPDGNGATDTDAATDAEAAKDAGPDAPDSDGRARTVDSGGDAGAGVEAGDVEAGEEAGLDAEAGASDAGSGADAGDGSGAGDAGDIVSNLVALYRFDETTGTTAADSSGNGRDATMVGATFASGLAGNAATMNGSSEYVSLPRGIGRGLTAFSIAAWVNLTTETQWCRIFDFGTGTTTYAFLTPDSGGGTLRYAITTAGNTAEERIEGPLLATAAWKHVAVTFGAGVGTLYVDGAQVGQNTSMTMSLATLGTTTQNWLGRSQFSVDPFLDGEIDDFRIYSRALTANDVATLFAERQ